MLTMKGLHWIAAGSVLAAATFSAGCSDPSGTAHDTNTSPNSPPPPFVAAPTPDPSSGAQPPVNPTPVPVTPTPAQPPANPAGTPTTPAQPPAGDTGETPPVDNTPAAPPPAQPPPSNPPPAEPATPPPAAPPAASPGAACEELVPASTDIDLSTVDSMDQWGDTSEFFGGFFSYPNAVALDFSGGTLAVSGDIEDYSGFGLWFGPCADLSGSQGIQFDVSGLGEDTLTVAIQSHATYIYDEKEEYPKGGCIPDDPDKPWNSCVFPKKTGITDGTAVQIAWSEFAGGVPEAKTDGSQVLGVQFEFPWPGDPRSADIVVSNISFY